jgi:hypothetical protein
VRFNRDAFGQALHLHRAARTLHRELKQAEAAFAVDPTDENYRHLVEIQARFRDVQATKPSSKVLACRRGVQGGSEPKKQ